MLGHQPVIHQVTRSNLCLLDSVKSPSLSLIVCEQVRWFALKIVLIAVFCNCSKKSELFLEQDPIKYNRNLKQVKSSLYKSSKGQLDPERRKSYSTTQFGVDSGGDIRYVTVPRERFIYYHTEVLKGSLLLQKRITERYMNISGSFDCPV